ncbi:hypothetical protein [Micromonospora sediminicola]|uniref:hypothetical protein n=1 Tax=Micromonospora sediminicola TaxID=946078 RepID=UPI0037B33037
MSLDIDAARKLADAAEDGPWISETHPLADDNPSGWPLTVIRSASGARREVAAVIEDDVASASECPMANAEFIAAARTLVPQLCDALDAARAEILAVESLLAITDGDPLGDRGIAIPLSEIRRVLAEARAGVAL